MVGYVLTIASVVFGLIGRKSKLSFAFILVACWILMGLNTYNADFVGYQYFYDGKVEEWSGLNLGYVFSEYIGWTLGLDYIQYRMLFSAVGLLLIADTVRRYTANCALVMALYVLGSFFYDIVQFKFFLAASVAIFAFRFVIDRNRFFVVKYIAAMLVVYSIHPAAFLFCFFLVGLLSKRKAFITSVVAALFILILVYSGIAQALFSSLVEADKAEVYFTEMSRFGAIPYFVSILLQVLLVYWTQLDIHSNAGIVEKAGRETSAGNRYARFFESAVYAFLPLVAFVPLSVQNFYRPARSATILLFIYFAIVGFDQKDALTKRGRTALLLLLLVWLIFTDFVVYCGVIELVVATELENNLLWS